WSEAWIISDPAGKERPRQGAGVPGKAEGRASVCGGGARRRGPSLAHRRTPGSERWSLGGGDWLAVGLDLGANDGQVHADLHADNLAADAGVELAAQVPAE